MMIPTMMQVESNSVSWRLGTAGWSEGVESEEAGFDMPHRISENLGQWKAPQEQGKTITQHSELVKKSSTRT